MRRPAFPLLLVLAALSFLAAPAAALSPFFVFFDRGSARIGAHYDQLLDNTIEQARLAEAGYLLIEARTDSAGPAAANLALARRRGAAVKAALVRRGFRADRILVIAYGEEDPHVPTPDGLAEPRNRMVAIHLTRICRSPPGLPPPPQPLPGCPR